ncbi:hypothetical protein, partial [Paraburkholderia youngii]|uniref:hypothetical protein n=1 Tax=Paraburkholderia youngii TaxID=2782701 RepID=UPI001C86395D
THRRDVLLRRPQEIQMYPDREPIAIDTESHISSRESFLPAFSVRAITFWIGTSTGCAGAA